MVRGVEGPEARAEEGVERPESSGRGLEEGAESRAGAETSAEWRAFESDCSSEERGAFAERISDVFLESRASSLASGPPKTRQNQIPDSRPRPLRAL